MVTLTKTFSRQNLKFYLVLVTGLIKNGD